MASQYDRLMQARALIQEKRYDEARWLLESVNAPKAREWLAKLDQIAPKKEKSSLPSFTQPQPQYSSSIPSVQYEPMVWSLALKKSMVQWTMLIIFLIIFASFFVNVGRPETVASDGTTQLGPIAEALSLLSTIMCLGFPFAVYLIARSIRHASTENETWSVFHFLKVPFLYNSIVARVERYFIKGSSKTKRAYNPSVSNNVAHIMQSPSIVLPCQNSGGLSERIIHDYMVRELIQTFGFSPTDIEIEFSIRMGSSSKRADVVIFNRGASHIQENILAIIECKKMLTSSASNTRLMNEGENQLKSYMASCINARFGAVAGAEWKAFELVKGYNGNTFHEIKQFPSATGMNVAFRYSPR